MSKSISQCRRNAAISRRSGKNKKVRKITSANIYEVNIKIKRAEKNYKC